MRVSFVVRSMVAVRVMCEWVKLVSKLVVFRSKRIATARMLRDHPAWLPGERSVVMVDQEKYVYEFLLSAGCYQSSLHRLETKV